MDHYGEVSVCTIKLILAYNMLIITQSIYSNMCLICLINKGLIKKILQRQSHIVAHLISGKIYLFYSIYIHMSHANDNQQCYNTGSSL